ncbi:ABC transporter permease [Lentibacillus sp. Marseille-P4043]|uniref:ABC transporter permease n=1 Tax=Lentibacillus sp. Marseille-P4043 TaxID=2040293 RepID=UPI000D0B0DD1|nr:peptide ABC transporter permease [Lentibacillus sp. Marseille-P4043]
MINWRLWLGMVLTVSLVFIAIFGPALAPYDEDFMEPSGYYYNDNDDFGVYAAPFAPSRDHLLGTDQYGYDILTLLLYGAKYTLVVGVLVALLRIVIGALFGLLNGIRNNHEKVGSSFGLLGSIPAFIIIYFVMIGIVVNSSFSMMELILIQSILMTLVGIPGVYAAVFSKTKELKKNLYISASKALGARSFRIAWKHLLPHLKGTLMVMFVKEIILVLSLIGQLGIFNVFLGGTIYRQGGEDVYLSVTHDWAGLIGQWRSFVYDYHWVLFYPLLAFVLVIFSLYILSRGLELKDKQGLKKYPHI